MSNFDKFLKEQHLRTISEKVSKNTVRTKKGEMIEIQKMEIKSNTIMFKIANKRQGSFDKVDIQELAKMLR